VLSADGLPENLLEREYAVRLPAWPSPASHCQFRIGSALTP
jgi:hypothetical protein